MGLGSGRASCSLEGPEGGRIEMNKAQRCHGYDTACVGIVIGIDREWTYKDATSTLKSYDSAISATPA